MNKTRHRPSQDDCVDRILMPQAAGAGGAEGTTRTGEIPDGDASLLQLHVQKEHEQAPGSAKLRKVLKM